MFFVIEKEEEEDEKEGEEVITICCVKDIKWLGNTTKKDLSKIISTFM